MARQLFIYWKTEAGSAAVAAAAMVAFQHALTARRAGLLARLYRRAAENDSGAAFVTLMETYACPGGVDAALQAEIVAGAARAAAGWCQGERHVEVFDELCGDAADDRAR